MEICYSRAIPADSDIRRFTIAKPTSETHVSSDLYESNIYIRTETGQIKYNAVHAGRYWIADPGQYVRGDTIDSLRYDPRSVILFVCLSYTGFVGDSYQTIDSCVSAFAHHSHDR